MVMRAEPPKALDAARRETGGSVERAGRSPVAAGRAAAARVAKLAAEPGLICWRDVTKVDERLLEKEIDLESRSEICRRR
jgi:hypothetical protein